MPVMEEGSNKPTKWRGVFAYADRQTSNGRFYSRKLWENTIGNSDVKARLAGGMIGVLNHPKDGETDLMRSAIATFSLSIENDGAVVGESTILPTVGGDILQKLIESGVQVGVSSRGRGSIDADGKVNEDDFVLIAFDVVDNPAVKEAFPNVSESKENVIDRRSNMAGALDTYWKLEQDISPTLKAVEDGNFTNEQVQPIDAILRNTIERLGDLVESEKNSIAKDLTQDLQRRILECRRLLSKGPKKPEEPKNTEKVEEGKQPDKDPDTKIVEEEVEKLNLDALKDAKIATEDKNKTDKKPVDELDDKSLRAYVQELEKINEELEKKYKEVSWALEEMKSEKEKADVGEALETAIKDNPSLEKVRSLLEESNTVEELNKRVTQLTELTQNESSKTQKITSKGNTDDSGDALPPPGASNKSQVTEAKKVDSKPSKTEVGTQFKSIFVALDESTKK